jgi:hypothetical protein
VLVLLLAVVAGGLFLLLRDRVRMPQPTNSAPVLPSVAPPAAPAGNSPGVAPRPSQDPTIGRICAESGWCWDWPRPLGSTLTAVWAAGSDVWAVGKGGTVIARHGGPWAYAGLDGMGDLVSVWGRTGTDVWALGREGHLAHWADGAWHATVNDVHDEADRRHAAESGRIAFNGIWVSPSGHVWAAGGVLDSVPRGREDESGDRSHIALLAHDDGGRWRLEDRDDHRPLRWVWGTSDSDVWACTDASSCLHWDGRTLSSKATPPRDLEGRHHGVVEGAEAWHVERGRVRRVGVNESNAANRPIARARDFFAVGTGDVWAVGDAGLILHWDGLAWSGRAPVDPDPELTRLYDVWSSGSGEAWAVGYHGAGTVSSTVLRSQNAGFVLWPPISGRTGAVSQVIGDSPTSIWMSGAAGIFHTDGSSLDPAAMPDVPAGAEITVARDGEIWWAAGSAIVHGRAGGPWKSIPAPSGRQVSRLGVIDGSDVWAYAPAIDARTQQVVRDKAVLAHWTGGDWATPFTVEEEQAVLGPWRGIQRMAAAPDGTLWITDKFHVVRIASRGRPESVAEANANKDEEWFIGLWVAAADEVWVCGSAGVQRWDGRSWHREVQPGRIRLEAIHGTADSVWAVGAGAVLHKDRARSNRKDGSAQ